MPRHGETLHHDDQQCLTAQMTKYGTKGTQHQGKHSYIDKFCQERVLKEAESAQPVNRQVVVTTRLPCLVLMAGKANVILGGQGKSQTDSTD